MVADYDLNVVARHHVRLTKKLFGADVPVFDSDLQLAAPLHRVARIDHKVQHRVLGAGRIGIGGPEGLGRVDLDLHPLAQGAAHDVVDIPQQIAQVDRAGLQRLPAAEGEQLRRERGTALHRAHRRIDPHPRRRIRGDLARGHGQAAGHHLQQIVEVMGDATGKIAHRLDPLALRQSVMQLFQFAVAFLDTLFQRRIQIGQLARQFFLFVNVGIRADPPHQSALVVPDWCAAHQMPAIGPIGPPQTKLGRIDRTGLHRMGPSRDRLRAVIGVNDRRPSVAHQTARFRARKGVDLIADPIEPPIGGGGPDMNRHGMGHGAEPFLGLAQPGFGKLMGGHVIALDHDADGLAMDVVERLEHEIHHDTFRRTLGAAAHPCLGPMLADGLSGPVNLVEHFEEALARDLGQRLADGFADEIPLAHQLHIGGVDRAEDVVRPHEGDHEVRCLFEDHLEKIDPGIKLKVLLGHLMGAAQHGGLSRVWARVIWRFGGVYLGDVLRVLQKELDLPLRAQDRRMGRTPIAVFGRAVGRVDRIRNDRQVIGGAVAKHPLERRPQHPPRLAFGVRGELFEQDFPDKPFQLAVRDLQIGVIGPDHPKLTVQQYERRRRCLEDSFKVVVHLGGSSIQ